MSNFLSPFAVSKPDLSVTVLIVGAEGTSKHELSKSLVEMVTPFKTTVHTCTCLPVPDDSSLYKTGVDFICFVLHLANTNSLKVVQASIGTIDVSYFIGRSALVVNTKGKSSEEGITTADVQNLAGQYGIPVLYCDVEVDSEKTDTARKIIKLVEVASGFKKNVSPLLFETVNSVDKYSKDMERQTPTRTQSRNSETFHTMYDDTRMSMH